MSATIDQVAMLPLYAAATTALLAFVADLIRPGHRGLVLTVTALGAAGTGVVAVLVGHGPVRGSFCVPAGCSLVANRTGALIAVLFAAATLIVLALSGPSLAPRDRSDGGAGMPAGEYCFLLGASMTGGVALGYAGDLITVLVALETLTLPLYALVALRRRTIASAEGAVTFFVVSVVSSAVSLMGAALVYAVTGALHLGAIHAALADHPAVRNLPLTRAAVVLVLAGLAFKIAAVPFHAWAPAAYDNGPTPIAAYLSTAGKVGGVVAILAVSVRALGPSLAVTGPVLAILAAVTMTVGNLVALRQQRMVRLLAWSSIAQAGYIIAPLGAAALARGRTPGALSVAVSAVLAYTCLYVVLELAAFGAVIALRGGADGGDLADYRGAGRRYRWIGAAFTLALIGLAGLPPGFAGLFAKIIVVRSLLTGGSAWPAIVVAINAVIGLAYYVRAVGVLYAAPSSGDPVVGRPAPGGRAVGLALGVATAAGLVLGFAPEWLLRIVDRAVGH